MNLFTTIIASMLGSLSVLIGVHLGKTMNCNCKNKTNVIQFPKFKKEEPIIYNEKKTEEEEKANYFYK